MTPIGAELFSILEPLKEKVAIVISADMAHTHLTSGPYGYSNASEPFDQVSGTIITHPWSHMLAIITYPWSHMLAIITYPLPHMLAIITYPWSHMLAIITYPWSHMLAIITYPWSHMQAVGVWASTLNSISLLNTAAGLADRALSCGFTGLVMVHGLMEAK